jgi:hypothetical protein
MKSHLIVYVIDNLNKKYEGDPGFVLGKKSCKQGYSKHWMRIYKVFDPIVNMLAVLYKKFGQAHGADRNERTLMYQESEMQNSSTFLWALMSNHIKKSSSLSSSLNF